MKFSVYQESRVGPRRDNQDRLAYRYSSDALLLVVADGMGGYAHGELAAQVAVDHLVDAFEHRARPRLDEPFSFLAECFNGAHAAIGRVAAHRGLDAVPRTTLVACVAQDGIAYWAHAGDSRLYLLREGRIHACTQDHSRVQLLLRQGLIDDDEARQHPQRNRVFSCLGGAVEPQIEFSRKVPLYDQDVLALCSDGVWGPLGDDRLAQGLAAARPGDAVPALLDEAERIAGRSGDNLSLLALRWEEGLAGESPSDEELERAIDQIRGIIRPSQK